MTTPPKVDMLANDSSQLFLWELLAGTLIDDAKLIRFLKIFGKCFLEDDNQLPTESNRNTRRRIAGLQSQLHAKMLTANRGAFSDEQQLALKNALKDVFAPARRQLLRQKIIKAGGAGPAWSLRLIPICFPAENSANFANAPQWTGALWFLAVELKSRVLLIEQIPWFVTQDKPSEFTFPPKLFSAPRVEACLERIHRTIRAFGRHVHFPSDYGLTLDDCYEQLQLLINRPLPTPQPEWTDDPPEGVDTLLEVAPNCHHDTPPVHPSNEDSPIFQLPHKPSSRQLEAFQITWNAIGRESAPIADFRDIVPKRRKTSKGVITENTLDICYRTLLPFLGIERLTNSMYFSDFRAARWKVWRENPLKINATRMPLGFKKKASTAA